MSPKHKRGDRPPDLHSHAYFVVHTPISSPLLLNHKDLNLDILDCPFEKSSFTDLKSGPRVLLVQEPRIVLIDRDHHVSFVSPRTPHADHKFTFPSADW